MPSVNVAMERSLREGAANLLAASIRPLLDRRAGTITESVTDVKTAFSSWDNCMNFTYCKWPVIAVIIIGGLIVFSVVWCLVRCLCCGLSCCCQCFACLKCCGNCCGCCDPPKGTPHKYLDNTYHQPNQGYRSQEPMHAGPASGPKPLAPFSATEPPKYAEFDVSKKSGNEDALPAMPSWEGSANKKVALEETVELEDLKKPEGPASNPSTQNLLPMPGAIPGPASPVNNYRGGPAGPYQAARPGVADPYAASAQGYSNMPGGAYSQQDLGYNGYGAPGMSVTQGRGMPGNANGPYGQGRGYPGPQGRPGRQATYDDYGRGATQDYGPEGAYGQAPASPYDDQNTLGSQYARAPNKSPAPHQQGGYGYGDAPRRSPAPQADYGYSDVPPRRSPAPPADYGYGDAPARRSPAPQTGYAYGVANESYDGRSRVPQPQRKFSTESTRPLNPHVVDQRQYANNGPSQPPISPLHSTGGYVQDQSYDDSYGGRPKGPSRQNTGGDSYPGYQPYQPGGGGGKPRGQQGWNGV